MPKFNKGDRARVRLTSHSRYRGQTGVIEDNPESNSTPPAGSSGLWYMVRFEWKGLHPAARFREEDLESPTVEIDPEAIPVTAGTAPQSWRERITQQPAGKKYLFSAIAAVVVIAVILVGINIGRNHGLPIKPGSTNPTLTPGLTEEQTTTKLAFTTSLIETKAGFAFPVQPVIKIVDADGNIITDSTAAVTLIVTNHKAVLYGETTVNAVNGIATFTDTNIQSAGYNYSLTAICSGSTPAVSNSFNVVPSPAIILGFASDPVSSGLGSQFTIEVAVMDLFQNVVTDSNVEVTLKLADSNNVSGAVLSGTTTQKAKNGVATFSYLSINPPEGNYKLTASSPDLFPATSNSFNPSKIIASTSSP